MLIMTETGLPVYIAPLEESLDVDEGLLTGFLSALHSFGKETAGEISSMNFGSLFMNFLSKEKLIFVIAHDQTLSDRIIHQLLEEVSNHFLE